MPRITNFAAAVEALEPYARATTDVHAAYTLERMQVLMAALGNPENRLKVIHIAGTSGKTSTAYYMAALLKQSGVKVGLTVSPHIDQINERLQIDLTPLLETQYCAVLEEFLGLLKPLAVTPTYFELMVAMAYWYFAKIGVDYAVVEVGLGGLLDSTNIATRTDKICIITDIGLDHTQILGSTIQEITAQKAGIIKLENEVFCYEQGKEVDSIIQTTCRQKNATLHICQPEPAERLLNDLPLFQRRNWQLAAKAFEHIVHRDDLMELDFNQWQSSQKIYIPGRMEIIKLNDKTVILDGAHNPQKMTALLGSLEQLTKGEAFVAIVAFRQGKDIGATLKILDGAAANIIATEFTDKLGTTHSAPLAELKNSSYVDAVESDLTKAITTLLERPEHYLLISGSLYLIHQAREILANKNQ